MPLCSRTRVLSEGGGEIDVGWRVGGVGVGGVKPMVV